MIKHVNGVDVELTPEEEAAVLAEWAANDAKPPPPRPINLADELAKLRGILVRKLVATAAEIDAEPVTRGRG